MIFNSLCLGSSFQALLETKGFPVIVGIGNINICKDVSFNTCNISMVYD